MVSYVAFSSFFCSSKVINLFSPRVVKAWEKHPLVCAVARHIQKCLNEIILLYSSHWYQVKLCHV